ncbi:hypothetical protein C3489_31890 [Streptomyces sp. Ru71]|uniref:hypothetical protein n=1 Tax=Streptomyces sp. Ru71 TaxID=2080746 RepID=UPI000CDE1705|nr:hypothetical protein [Streptomyces sp. Ru71]POX46384.1 hypothetical protein C3489_31890 [Streptomyces sp. Ru71]
MTSRHEVRLHRMGRWWALDVPGLDLHSQCRTLDEAEVLARDLIAEASGTAPERVAVHLVVPELAPELDAVAGARRRREAAVAAEREAVAAAVRILVDTLGIGQGDVSRLLGLSPDEVAQLTPRPVSRSGAAHLSRVAPPGLPRPRPTTARRPHGVSHGGPSPR